MPHTHKIIVFQYQGHVATHNFRIPQSQIVPKFTKLKNNQTIAPNKIMVSSSKGRYVVHNK